MDLRWPRVCVPGGRRSRASITPTSRRSLSASTSFTSKVHRSNCAQTCRQTADLCAHCRRMGLGRDPAAPLRIPVLDRYHDRGTVALGKVESGSVRVGMKVRPSRLRRPHLGQVANQLCGTARWFIEPCLVGLYVVSFFLLWCR